MKREELKCLFAGLVVLCALGNSAARADMTVASNLTPTFQESGFRTDIGYSGGSFENTAVSQRFIPTLDGLLSTMTLYVRKWHAITPLLVSVHENNGGLPGQKLGEISFTDLPTSYFPPKPPTVLDLSPMSLMLQANNAYHAVFRTTVPAAQLAQYSLHVLEPHPASFGLPYLHSGDGGQTWSTFNYYNLEVAMAIAAAQSPTGRIEVAPTLDAKADFSFGGSSLIDGEAVINVQRVDFADVDRRGVLEFDISQIPDSVTITSATLELDIEVMTHSSDSYPVLELYGYPGNGTLELADALDLSNHIGQCDPILNLDTITIGLEPAYIKSLLAVSDYLGLLAMGDENGHQAGFVTLEGSIPDVRFAPKLSIEYVPEPISLFLLALGGLGLLRRRRA